MSAEVVDPVVVMNRSVFFHGVIGTDAVFHHHQRTLIAVVDHLKIILQTIRIIRPAPVGICQIFIAGAAHHVSRRFRISPMRGNRHRHVVREGIHVNGAFPQILQIFLCDLQFDIVFFPELRRIGRIIPEALHITAIENSFLPAIAVVENILRIIGMRVVGNAADHTADPVFRIDFMTDLHRLCGGDKLIVKMLVGLLEVTVRHVIRQEVDRIVDLIEGQPVLYEAFEFGKAGSRKLHEKINQLPVLPVSERLFEIQRRIKMPDRHQRFDPILPQFLKYTSVECNPLRIRFFFKTCRIQPAPADRHPEYLESHLGKQCDVFLIAMIEINAVMVRVKILIQYGIMRPFRQLLKSCQGSVVSVFVNIGDLSCFRGGSAGSNICKRRASSVNIPGTFDLIGSGRAAP